MYANEQVSLTTEAVAAVILGQLKKTAEAATGTKVHDVVISVPAYWTDAQRKALSDASQIAGLNCLRFINDTAASMFSITGFYYNILTNAQLPLDMVSTRLIYQRRRRTPLRSCSWTLERQAPMSQQWLFIRVN